MLLSLYVMEEWKSQILIEIRFLLSILLEIRLLNHSSLWSDVLFSVEEVGVGKWESTAYLYPFYPPSTAYLAREGPERRLGYTRALTWFGMSSSCVHTANNFRFMYVFPKETSGIMYSVEKYSTRCCHSVIIIVNYIRIVWSLSVSFFIEKEPHKQLRMKRKRRGER